MYCSSILTLSDIDRADEMMKSFFIDVNANVALLSPFVLHRLDEAAVSYLCATVLLFQMLIF